MMRKWIIATTLVGFSVVTPASECEQVYQQHLQTDMTLSYAEFDQTPGQGFRALASLGCEQHAADLIQDYIAATNAEQSSLRWHIAQLRATHGDYASAINYAIQSLSDTEDFDVRPLRWNDYVLATIGFLERDKDKLIFHRDQVAAAIDAHAGNALNLKLLDSLITNFDDNYAHATSHIE